MKKESLNRISRRWSVIFQLHQNWSLWPRPFTFFRSSFQLYSDKFIEHIFYLNWMKSFFYSHTFHYESIFPPSYPYAIDNVVRGSLEILLNYGKFAQSFMQNINWINVSNEYCHDTFKRFKFPSIHHFGCAVSYDKGLANKCCRFESIWITKIEIGFSLIFFWTAFKATSVKHVNTARIFALHNAKRCAKICLMLALLLPIHAINELCLQYSEFSGFLAFIEN